MPRYLLGLPQRQDTELLHPLLADRPGLLRLKFLHLIEKVRCLPFVFIRTSLLIWLPSRIGVNTTKSTSFGSASLKELFVKFNNDRLCWRGSLTCYEWTKVFVYIASRKFKKIGAYVLKRQESYLLALRWNELNCVSTYRYAKRWINSYCFLITDMRCHSAWSFLANCNPGVNKKACNHAIVCTFVVGRRSLQPRGLSFVGSHQE